MKLSPRINIITLGVTDLKRSISFYENGLGWTKSPASQENIVFFRLNGIVLALYNREALAEDAGIENSGNGFTGITLAYNTSGIVETDEIMKHVEKAGAKIIKPAQNAFWGGYSGYFADPDGYLFEVAYNPFIELNNEGNLEL